MAQSMNLNSAAGLPGMLKSGHQHMEGLDAATLRNVEAAKGLSSIVKSSLGPHGMNKLVINHLNKIIVTSDCATIVKELEIEHPAAKMLCMAAEMQDSECGDGTNLTVSLAGELLAETEGLLRKGLHTSEVIAGYKKASDKLMEILPGMAINTGFDPRNEEELTRVTRPVVMAKHLGTEDVLGPLVSRACIGTMSKTGRAVVHADGVRVAKILGGNVSQSEMIRGMVILRGVETLNTTAVENAKVVIFGCGVEASGTEAKGTVLMKNAEELTNYNKTEESKMEEIIKSIADAGVNVIVSGGTVSEMALHFIEKYEMMCVKIGSKWEIRRLCKATNSSALVRLGPPTPDEMGFCDHVYVKEIGGKNVTVFKQNEDTKDGCRISTVILRASTSSLLADLERAIEDGVHACRTACEDSRFVAGGGASEMELSVKIRNFGDTCPGLDQYSVRAFAKALEFVPRTLAENSGQDPTKVLTALGAAHANGESTMGVDINGDNPNGIMDTANASIVDLLSTKISAFRLAIDAAITVLRVDQIIMAKQAGGGKMMQ
mmetsp:Transcript_15943/g.23365  ORF Transcript_15943/g.23365 Transcript_15943/m.23365 type:complete len:547 (+) Transcript_15943:124-1764(+)|eukprot:CAMPEP_0195536746 /NCGR_PEP_ID=MMETSP0794_2-20130614/46642_1 /TAXON_ID=515487 /ORGANISM="Stephanopyxis turris, Strain CCMP 815" /LENGTH=546 /DNA_ID=CAMNT_0040670251 /DNA_START=111 /DNA_END=1751 /DNA_ORIENTATION=+